VSLVKLGWQNARVMGRAAAQVWPTMQAAQKSILPMWPERIFPKKN
jgi:hypothetical protein